MTSETAGTYTRAETNRANAQHSTGPKTQGKANSSRNSFKHGLYSKQLVTSSEEAAELDALKADLRAEHQPANETEEILVNEMAEQFWRIRRARRMEASILDDRNVVLTHLAAVQRMMTSAERGFHKALSTVRQLQKGRGFVPQTAEHASNVGQAPGPANSGFVPQKDEAASLSEPKTKKNEPRPQRAKLKANSCSLTAIPVFVPSECPADIDHLDWSRFCESVNRVRNIGFVSQNSELVEVPVD
jgi:hypothetical protein